MAAAAPSIASMSVNSPTTELMSRPRNASRYLPVLPPDRRAPVFRHRLRGHLLDDDVAVNVNDQRAAGHGAIAARPAPPAAVRHRPRRPTPRRPGTGRRSRGARAPPCRCRTGAPGRSRARRRGWTAVSPARAFCSTSRIVLPCACIIRTASKTDLSTLGASPIDGSSRITSFGSSMRLRANSTSRCCPPDRLPAFLSSQSCDLREHLQHPGEAPVGQAALAQDVAAEADVLAHRHLAEQAVVLRYLDHAGAEDLAWRLAGQPLAVQRDLSQPRPQQPADGGEQGRFPGTVRSHHAGDPALHDLDGYPTQDITAAVPGDHARHFERVGGPALARGTQAAELSSSSSAVPR